MSERKDKGYELFEVFHQSDAISCGIASLLMLYRDTVQASLDMKRAHRELYMESYEVYPGYYPFKIAATFVRHFPNTHLTFFIDTPKQYDLAHSYNKERQISVVHQPLSANWIVNRVQRGTPLAVRGDYYYLGYAEHTDHFINVVNNPERGVLTLDPSYFGKQPLDPERLMHFLNGFKYVMNASPLAISMTVNSR